MASVAIAGAAPPAARRGRDHRAFEALIVPLVLLALWQIACTSGLFPPQILVPPSDVLRELAALAQTGELQRHVGESLGRLGLGFAIGGLLGLAFGVALALSRWTEAALSPLFLGLWQVPVIAFVPMLVMFLGIEEAFKVTIVAVAAFFPVALATFDAIRGIPRAWIEVSRVYRLTLLQLVGRILIPATVPPVLTGLRVALTRAWLVLIAAELLAADSGVGQMMEMGRQLFRIDTVLAGVVVSGIIGFLLDAGARAVERRASRWKAA
ncbi:ABC transporter permease [Sphingomonas profundi]|uniref:ABC transporter permease n=1 Tax=Alterirhizorhabdus profundi TaxID=2681549 RepID=UPI0012E957B7|nr:ABC transporter permease [Sphingomonas profundi]